MKVWKKFERSEKLVAKKSSVGKDNKKAKVKRLPSNQSDLTPNYPLQLWAEKLSWCAARANNPFSEERQSKRDCKDHKAQCDKQSHKQKVALAIHFKFA